MRRRTLLMWALLGITTSGCKQVNEGFAKVSAKVSEQYAKLKETIAAKIAARRGRGRPAPATPPTTPAAPPTPAPQTGPPARGKAKGPGGGGGGGGGAAPGAPTPPEGMQAPALARPLRDRPYDSPDTGTIAPGMNEKDIYSRWGPPIAVRHQGEMTFLYFRNGCEYSCGTEDVVFLDKGQVVDAVLRWPGHGYSGQSSSPAATQPHARHGGDTLTVKPPTP
ncbi:MAG TPA: hypothetical protein VH116_12865 [Gemmatimonadales bacterium]|jgi:hypothetical protein|nr:hypothetical protein [Gemmatimonadales bacterium]